jgi:hypothetical protein
MKRKAGTSLVAAATLGIAAGTALAATPLELLGTLEQSARASDARFAGFSAERGRQFFTATHAAEWSCSSCHTDNPLAPGRHARTQKIIAPLAPAADAKRFTDPAKVDKWFTRNCKDVVGRPCTMREQGDVLAYLLTFKAQGGAR